MVADRERAENPTLEVAHEALFAGWRRLSRWIESNAGKLRVCRSLALAARDWQQAGAPAFKHLPDRATLKKYRGVHPTCSLGEDAEVVHNFLGAARRRQRPGGGFLALMELVVGILVIDARLRSREMNWTVLGIWALAQVGLYDGSEMVPIPGTDTPFQMGSSDCEPNSDSDECPQHPVTIQRFLMGRYEVTFDDYAAFVLDKDDVELPHDEDWGRGSRPVINVSWNDAQHYIEWLNEKVKGEKFRLPTEAEWEYAARVGTETAYSFGNDPSKLNEYGWYSDNSDGKTHPAGEKKPNGWDLYDMHGHVWEWVEDDWHDNYGGAPDEGHAWVDDPRGADRVMCGGGWNCGAHDCRSANRSYYGRYSSVGFRLSSSRQRPDAVYLRIPRLCQGTDPVSRTCSLQF